MQADKSIRWKTFEYGKRNKKSVDWFWALGIVILGATVVAILFGDPLLGIFIVIAGISLGMHAIRHPREINFMISERGIHIDDNLYPYSSLEAFWIIEEKIPNKLLIKTGRFLESAMVIPLEGITADQVRSFLFNFLEQEEIHLPVAEHIRDWFNL